jgi:hypothetical protein
MQGTPPPMCHNMGWVSLANILLLLIEPTFTLYHMTQDLNFPPFSLVCALERSEAGISGSQKKWRELDSMHFTFVKKRCSFLSLSSTGCTIPTIWEMSFSPLNPLCQLVGRCLYEPQPLGLEWISSHQCISWPFCPVDGLSFFIRR